MTLIWIKTYLDNTSKAQAAKMKMDKWDYVKLKSFCTAKKTIKKNKQTTTEWTKVLTNHASARS